VKEHYQMIDLAGEQDVDQIGKLISLHILAWKPLFEATLDPDSVRTSPSPETRS
jgi:hypothetical protein